MNNLVRIDHQFLNNVHAKNTSPFSLFPPVKNGMHKTLRSKTAFVFDMNKITTRLGLCAKLT